MAHRVSMTLQLLTAVLVVMFLWQVVLDLGRLALCLDDYAPDFMPGGPGLGPLAPRLDDCTGA